MSVGGGVNTGTRQEPQWPEAWRVDHDVARKVMGWEMYDDGLNWRWTDGSYVNGPDGMRFDPSTDIGSAWRVVERMAESHWGMAFNYSTMQDGVRGHFVKVLGSKHPALSSIEKLADVRADTAPMVICLAALEAVNTLIQLPHERKAHD